MNIKWMVQSTGFISSYVEEIVYELNNQNINWSDFGIINDTITNLENILDTNIDTYITRGGTKILKLLETNSLEELNPHLTANQKKLSDIYLKKIKQSIDYDEKYFNQKYYSTLGLPLLNDTARYFKIKDLLYSTFSEESFIKPSKDSKAFNGGIIYTDETLMNYLMRTPHLKIEDIEHEYMLVSPLNKNIKNEYRLFMYKDNILGASRYIKDFEVNPNEFVPKDIKNVATQLGRLYNPKELYVIDLCDFYGTDDIKIVEYNCWNCSGLYKVDIHQLIKSIHGIKNV